ncbi:MAG: hypothetical protein D8M53_09425 [Armatimonadetes bacterium]|nr:hypothetical protein [Armatimonadota bacterium]
MICQALERLFEESAVLACSDHRNGIVGKEVDVRLHDVADSTAIVGGFGDLSTGSSKVFVMNSIRKLFECVERIEARLDQRGCLGEQEEEIRVARPGGANVDDGGGARGRAAVPFTARELNLSEASRSQFALGFRFGTRANGSIQSLSVRVNRCVSKVHHLRACGC